MRNSASAVAILCLAMSLGLTACKKNTGIDLARCARLSACLDEYGTPIGVRRACLLQTLIDLFPPAASTERQLMRAEFECVGRATTCAELDACWYGDASYQAVCPTDGSNHEECIDGDAFICGYDYYSSMVFHCQAAGLSCIEQAGAFARVVCGEAICDPDTFQPRCEGSQLVTCVDGGIVRKDCSVWPSGGETCGETEAGLLGCIGAGAPCEEATFEERCDGDFIVACNSGRVGRLDCRSYQRQHTCMYLLDGGITCFPEVIGGCENPSGVTCQLGVVIFCLEGELTHLDCRDYGYAGCAVTYGRAYCTDEPAGP